MRLIYSETWTTIRRPVTYGGRRKPKKDPNSGPCLLALIGAVIGGATAGWGGAALGFVIVAAVWGVLEQETKS